MVLRAMTLVMGQAVKRVPSREWLARDVVTLILKRQVSSLRQFRRGERAYRAPIALLRVAAWLLSSCGCAATFGVATLPAIDCRFSAMVLLVLHALILKLPQYLKVRSIKEWAVTAGVAPAAT